MTRGRHFRTLSKMILKKSESSRLNLRKWCRLDNFFKVNCFASQFPSGNVEYTLHNPAEELQQTSKNLCSLSCFVEIKCPFKREWFSPESASWHIECKFGYSIQNFSKTSKRVLLKFLIDRNFLVFSTELFLKCSSGHVNCSLGWPVRKIR